MKPRTQLPTAHCQLAYCLLLIASCLIASCSVNKAKNDESLKKYFDENKVDGCFTMLNNADGKVTVYNMKYDTMRFSPASTFKIFNSLVGLQTGVITDEKMIIKWDGKTRVFPNGDTAKNWNKDMDMTEAFKVSSVPYYQEVARRIGKDTMQQWIPSSGGSGCSGSSASSCSITSVGADPSNWAMRAGCVPNVRRRNTWAVRAMSSAMGPSCRIDHEPAVNVCFMPSSSSVCDDVG